MRLPFAFIFFACYIDACMCLRVSVCVSLSFCHSVCHSIILSFYHSVILSVILSLVSCLLSLVSVSVSVFFHLTFFHIVILSFCPCFRLCLSESLCVCVCFCLHVRVYLLCVFSFPTFPRAVWVGPRTDAVSAPYRSTDSTVQPFHGNGGGGGGVEESKAPDAVHPPAAPPRRNVPSASGPGAGAGAGAGAGHNAPTAAAAARRHSVIDLQHAMSRDDRVLDPTQSPPVSSLSASDLVRRFNACLAAASGDTPSIVAEVQLLQEVALTMISDFPAAPTATETSAVVALAAMADTRVVSAVLNTLATRVAEAVSVSADSVLAVAQAARLAVDACRRSAA